MTNGKKLRLYPNKTQEQVIWQMFGNSRFVWNQLVAMLQERYKNNPSLRVPSNYTLNLLLKPLKEEYPFLKKGNSHSYQEVTRALYQTYQMMFKHEGGKPRFHSRKSAKQAYSDNSTAIKVVAKRYMKLPKLGYIKTSKTGALNNCTIKQHFENKKYKVEIIHGHDDVIDMGYGRKHPFKSFIHGPKTHRYKTARVIVKW